MFFFLETQSNQMESRMALMVFSSELIFMPKLKGRLCEKSGSLLQHCTQTTYMKGLAVVVTVVCSLKFGHSRMKYSQNNPMGEK